VRKEMNQYENIPEELKQLPQWVCHRNKIPFNPITGAPAACADGYCPSIADLKCPSVADNVVHIVA